MKPTPLDSLIFYGSFDALYITKCTLVLKMQIKKCDSHTNIYFYKTNVLLFFTVSLTWYESGPIDGGQWSATIFDMTRIRIAGHDGDLVQLVSIGGSDAAATATVGDQSAGGAVVRLFPTSPAQHQPFCR